MLRPACRALYHEKSQQRAVHRKREHWGRAGVRTLKRIEPFHGGQRCRKGKRRWAGEGVSWRRRERALLCVARGTNVMVQGVPANHGPGARARAATRSGGRRSPINAECAGGATGWGWSECLLERDWAGRQVSRAGRADGGIGCGRRRCTDLQQSLGRAPRCNRSDWGVGRFGRIVLLGREIEAGISSAELKRELDARSLPSNHGRGWSRRRRDGAAVSPSQAMGPAEPGCRQSGTVTGGFRHQRPCVPNGVDSETILR